MISRMGNTWNLTFVRVKTKLPIFTPFLQLAEVTLELFLIVFILNYPVNLVVIVKRHILDLTPVVISLRNRTGPNTLHTEPRMLPDRVTVNKQVICALTGKT